MRILKQPLFYAMKYFYIIILLSVISCRTEDEQVLVTSRVDCSVPADLAVPKGGFKNEDTLSVQQIVQLR